MAIPVMRLAVCGVLMGAWIEMSGQANAGLMEPLDRSRNVSSPVLEKGIHTPLPEEYVWTAEENQDARAPGGRDELEPHYFRAHFKVSAVPHETTVYVAGPRAVSVWLNGQLVEQVASDPSSPLRMHVFAASVAHALRAGDNVIAIEAMQRRGGMSPENSAVLNQVNAGRVLVVKIIRRAEAVQAPDLMHGGPDWRGPIEDALAWMRQFSGGMLAEGATSFWEAYDVDWYKGDFHASLQADNGSGYYVSLAHGWSSGPTAWLMEEVLGIQPTGAGFNTVNLRPDLVDLEWARGAMPTPHGLIKVDARKKGSATEIAVDVPEGVIARLSVPVSSASITAVRVNGSTQTSESEEGGTRRIVVLDHAGHYVVPE